MWGIFSPGEDVPLALARAGDGGWRLGLLCVAATTICGGE